MVSWSVRAALSELKINCLFFLFFFSFSLSQENDGGQLRRFRSQMFKRFKGEGETIPEHTMFCVYMYVCVLHYSRLRWAQGGGRVEPHFLQLTFMRSYLRGTYLHCRQATPYFFQRIPHALHSRSPKAESRHMGVLQMNKVSKMSKTNENEIKINKWNINKESKELNVLQIKQTKQGGFFFGFFFCIRKTHSVVLQLTHSFLRPPCLRLGEIPAMAPGTKLRICFFF